MPLGTAAAAAAAVVVAAVHVLNAADVLTLDP